MKISIYDFYNDCAPETPLSESDAAISAIQQRVAQKMKGSHTMKKSVKILLTVAAVVGILTASATVVNAATDGAVLAGVQKAATATAKRVSLFFGGKEVTGETSADADGNPVTVYSGKDESGEYSVEVHEDALAESGLQIGGSLDEGVTVSDQK